ncbi:MAG: hypothetical protein OEW15_18340 [Nitrospirota bacterium]|nr:hypothetical protein [Nitrospirota bacterium]
MHQRLFRTIVFLLLALPPAVCLAQTTGGGEEQSISQQTPPSFPDSPPPLPEAASTEQQDQQWLELSFEPDAYYSNVGMTVALTSAPIPHVGEQTEKEIYATLLSRAYAPRFLLLEASVNPLPCLGTYIRDRHETFYNDAEITGNFNWVKAVTAGFEEPYAASVFLGNVVNFDVPGNRDMSGKGYSGLLYSFGTYHIKDNILIRDDWDEFEWKVKGYRKTADRKLSWSFRVGAKYHENPYITDIVYLSFRRSRLDYKPDRASVFNNSGFEYTYDMDRKTLNAIRHYFTVDKKWPLAGGKSAFTVVLGVIWESFKKYTGPLSAGRETSDLQIILRPNIEF